MMNFKYTIVVLALSGFGVNVADDLINNSIVVSTPDNGAIHLEMGKDTSFIKIENRSSDPVTVEADKHNLQSIEEVDPCLVIPSGKDGEILISKNKDAVNIREDGRIVLHINKIRGNYDASKRQHTEYMTKEIPVHVRI